MASGSGKGKRVYDDRSAVGAGGCDGGGGGRSGVVVRPLAGSGADGRVFPIGMAAGFCNSCKSS